VIMYRAVKRPGVAAITFSDFEPLPVDCATTDDAAAGASLGTWIDGFGIDIPTL
jgi:hypothetical protein